MKHRHLFLRLFAWVIILSTSCKKSDTPPATALLTNGAWALSAFVLWQGASSYNHYEYLYDCEKDDFIILYNDGVIDFHTGAVPCDADQYPVYRSHWRLIADETQIVMDGDTATISSLSGSELVLSAAIHTRTGMATAVKTYRHVQPVGND